MVHQGIDGVHGEAGAVDWKEEVNGMERKKAGNNGGEPSVPIVPGPDSLGRRVRLNVETRERKEAYLT